MLPNSVPFDAGSFDWSQIPAAAGVFALYGADEHAEPFISRTPGLRRRLRRLLDPRPEQSKRLRLAGRVARIAFAVTGSDFESLFLLYGAVSSAFGERARKRLHLRPPFFLRMTMENAYPRVYVTNRVTKSAAADLFGPFPSRAAAEKCMEDVLNLFLLRRCTDDLHPDPAFPGCVYSEMKKCLAPCFKGCSDERYAEEAKTVHAFFATRGESLVQILTAAREQASEALNFEQAAEAHARLAKVETILSSTSPVIRPLSRLTGILLQPSAMPDHVAVFLLRQGELSGPAFYSVQGMRHPNEQSGSSSLFAHPVAMTAVPLESAPVTQPVSHDDLDRRLDHALSELGWNRPAKPSGRHLADHLCLFSRWYHRPQAKRTGEVIFAMPDGELPRKLLIRAISRVFRQGVEAAAGPGPAAPPQISPASN
ncbi:excinuclease ABC subunit C [Paracidobacterium acidisoli]|uniref:Excinuclease ABC subunit C n=1 Tax=Paracidobacterium acidisoli TaxID=2303751 RepID=A0A372IL54_9BACT|nr:excinuclease ABC subunit C [Paracidobacterium acidisoli]MBT9332253.1 excinuclease ABC subunit C [Paracidobacterium acidisoli]